MLGNFQIITDELGKFSGNNFPGSFTERPDHGQVIHAGQQHMRGKIGGLLRLWVAEFALAGQDDATEGLTDIGIELVEALAKLQIGGAAANQGAQQTFVPGEQIDHALDKPLDLLGHRQVAVAEVGDHGIDSAAALLNKALVYGVEQHVFVAQQTIESAYRGFGQLRNLGNAGVFEAIVRKQFGSHVKEAF